MFARPPALLLLLPLLATAFLSCGGSASETPWPVEPKGAALDPEGERGETSDVGAPADEVVDESESPPPTSTTSSSASDRGGARTKP